MKVGDLVKENWGIQRIGIIVAEVSRPPTSRRRLFKVLWDRHSPTLPETLTGPLWESQAEVISESR